MKGLSSPVSTYIWLDGWIWDRRSSFAVHTELRIRRCRKHQAWWPGTQENEVCADVKRPYYLRQEIREKAVTIC